jgi:Vitamin K-dependent gamma-carboxylase
VKAWATRSVDWWFEPVARGRIAALRTALYLFIFVDVLVTTAWVARHATVPGELYEPLMVGRLLPLPVPGPVFVAVIEIALLVTAAIGATGKWPRAAGIAVAVLYFEWMVIAFSYGKVDHDRVGFLVALAVLPTVGAAGWGDSRKDAASGWAVRAIQVAVVLTYFLAAFAKFRFGGFDWATGATLMRSVIRRGTDIGGLLINVPWLLVATQWFIIVFELLSPLLLVPGRIGRFMLVVCLLFHAVTYVAISIIFLPHVVCLLAFMPLERLRVRNPLRKRTEPGVAQRAT